MTRDLQTMLTNAGEDGDDIRIEEFSGYRNSKSIYNIDRWTAAPDVPTHNERPSDA